MFLKNKIYGLVGLTFKLTGREERGSEWSKPNRMVGPTLRPTMEIVAEKSVVTLQFIAWP